MFHAIQPQYNYGVKGKFLLISFVCSSQQSHIHRHECFSGRHCRSSADVNGLRLVRSSSVCGSSDHDICVSSSIQTQVVEKHSYCPSTLWSTVNLRWRETGSYVGSTLCLVLCSSVDQNNERALCFMQIEHNSFPLNMAQKCLIVSWAARGSTFDLPLPNQSQDKLPCTPIDLSSRLHLKCIKQKLLMASLRKKQYRLQQ